MDKLLDKEVHHLYKAPSLATYLPNTSSASMAAKSAKILQMAAAAVGGSSAQPGVAQPEVAYSPRPCAIGCCDSDDSMREDTPRSSSSTLVSSVGVVHPKPPSGQPENGGRAWQSTIAAEEQRAQSLEYLNLEQKFNSGARPKTSFLSRYNRLVARCWLTKSASWLLEAGSGCCVVAECAVSW